MFLLAGCSGAWGPARTAEPNAPTLTSASDAADTAFAVPVEATTPVAAPLRTLPLLNELNMLHIQVPRGQRLLAEKVWNHLRENGLDSETQLCLRRNGLRVGIGREQWWDAVKVALDAIEGARINRPDPIQMPPGFPLALELDTGPREQTLFFIDRDGILTGGTWPQSRNVLRVSYSIDPQQTDRVHLIVVPEVRQRLSGWRWIRTEAGLWQVPKHGGRAFPAAGFAVTLDPGEFVLLAPSEKGDLFGIVGGAFLTEERDGQYYDSYVFLRPVLRRDHERG
ncbi:MAG: hypothetical protein KKB50_16200 [Planctomycetes bacterium]|nr:hypothetical protein [Planctomycetota bacterium]